jgi:flagellar motor protein MotB
VVIPALVQNIKDYGVDVVEVIGHTDEVPMSGISNLDQNLIGASVGRFPIGGLRSTDNAGLAMARAVAVVRVLRGDPRLANVTILPLSGAQMIVPVDQMANGTQRGSDQRRRRIEIRLRRSTGQATASGVKVVDGTE